MIANPFRSKDRVSLIVLIAANLVPLAGVFLAGWDAGMIVVLYWSENLIIGFYNVLKMSLVPAGKSHAQATKPFMIVFFCVHYGIFCFGHGVFVFLFFAIGRSTEGFAGVGQVSSSALAGTAAQLIWAFLALAASHGVSFVQNFLRKKEYASTTLQRQMAQPYVRIVVLHVAIIAAAFPVMLFQSPAPLLVILICGKILLDLVLHKRSHRPKQGKMQEEREGKNPRAEGRL